MKGMKGMKIMKGMKEMKIMKGRLLCYVLLIVSFNLQAQSFKWVNSRDGDYWKQNSLILNTFYR
ncbi:hypothetical protein LJB84_01805 [Bacteroidales bacterium OttesenSCG-928-J19]|nr:hypothetical protein [Bacteroidales bacterium OttesenSCG-928-J19]